LLERLGSDEFRDIVARTQEGYTNAEIPSKLGCVEMTVERKLRLIPSTWGGVSSE
jgi:hypothetical protein